MEHHLGIATINLLLLGQSEHELCVQIQGIQPIRQLLSRTTWTDGQQEMRNQLHIYGRIISHRMYSPQKTERFVPEIRVHHLVEYVLEHNLGAHFFCAFSQGGCLTIPINKELDPIEIGVCSRVYRMRLPKQPAVDQGAQILGIELGTLLLTGHYYRQSNNKEIQKQFGSHGEGKITTSKEPPLIIFPDILASGNKTFLFVSPPQPQVPVGVSMFDFQTMCYTSPMMDLVTFMANSTGIDVRGQHFEEIFQAYHSELAAELRGKLGSAGDDLPDKYS